MPATKSAKKRLKTDRKRRARNLRVKAALKALVKNLHRAIDLKKGEEAKAILAKVTRDKSLQTYEKKLGIIMGSGYPSDATAVQCLHDNFNLLKKNNLIRMEWKTTKVLLEKKRQTPSTPNISLLFAFDYKLKQMLEEGAENISARLTELRDYTHKWALDNGFGLFAEEGYSSVTVSTIENKLEKDVGALNKALGEKGFVIANGYGKLKNQTFRIGHMGDHTLDDLKELLAAIEEIWEL